MRGLGRVDDVMRGSITQGSVRHTSRLQRAVYMSLNGLILYWGAGPLCFEPLAFLLPSDFPNV